MGRILAIDYGSHKVGLAVTDPEQIIANGLTTVLEPELLDYLTQYMEDEPVSTIVVGDPKNLDNKPADFAPAVDNLVDKLKQQFPEVTIEMEDERFTSQIAHQSMYHSGMKQKYQNDRQLVDKMSATLILQSYLEKQNT
jgi:putative Holliday junction resolvase